MFSAIFFNSQSSLRNGWWIAIFFAVLALGLFPLLLWTQQQNIELTPLTQAGLIFLVTGVVQLLRRESLFAVIGQPRLSRFSELFYGLLLGALLMTLPALFLMIGGVVHYRVNPIDISMLAETALLCFGVAAAEELMFRGFIFQRLIAGLGFVPAQLLISAYFVLTHLNNPGMSGATAWLAGANIFIASLCFGYAYWRTRSLIMPIALHFAANWVQGSVWGFGVSGNASSGWLTPQLHDATAWLSGGAFGLEASVPGLLGIGLLLILLARKAK